VLPINPGAIQRENFGDRTFSPGVWRLGCVSIFLSPGLYNRAHPRETMKIELTPANAAALTKYAALAGHTPTEFLNRYLSDNMVLLFSVSFFQEPDSLEMAAISGHPGFDRMVGTPPLPHLRLGGRLPVRFTIFNVSFLDRRKGRLPR
jgi:hypothetical protein